MNRRQQINKILHDHIDVDKNTDYTNYKKLITAIEEWHEQQVKSVDLADVVGRSEQLPEEDEEPKCPDHTPYWGVCSTCGQY